MRHFISKILIIALIVLSIPTQAFASGSGNNTSSGGSVPPNGGNILINPDPITKVYASSTGQDFTSPINVDVLLRANVASMVGSTNTFGLGATHENLSKVVATYNLYGPTPTQTGKINLSKSSGSEYRKNFKVFLSEPGTYYLSGETTAHYGKKSYSKPFSIKLTVAAPAAAPEGPSCSISGPSSGVVGKTYTFDGSDWVNMAGSTITNRTWSVNSPTSKFSFNGKTATLTPIAPSDQYQITYTVTDNFHRSDTFVKNVKIVNEGPVITLAVESPIQVNQESKISFSVDTKGHTLSYKWGKSTIPYGSNAVVYGFSNAVTFKAPGNPPSTGSFKSSEVGEYIISVTATDTKTGESFPVPYKHIQVVNGLQAAIQLKSTVIQGEKCSAKSISVAPPPARIVREYWAVTNPNGATKKTTIDGFGTSVPIDTSILGTHTATLYVMDNGGNLSSIATKTVKVVPPGTTIAEPPVEPNPLYPENMEELIDFDDIVLADDTPGAGHMLDWDERGLTVSSRWYAHSSPQRRHISNANGDGNQELDTAFQRWDVTIMKSSYNSANQPILSAYDSKRYINGKDCPLISGKDAKSGSFVYTFNEPGKYQVIGRAMWYCETQTRRYQCIQSCDDPKSPGPGYKHSYDHCCYVIKYDGGAKIEEHGGIVKDVVITQEMVGKPITFNAAFDQQTDVPTESYLVE